ncbi:odorant receptor 43a-like [Sitodiplosis mosellana]|uniref:odorant receptor 43a-like n=1 Tax=Sitodiplosis mosellana TaxID=263140 RepID=UPI00244463DE|nr:odorant receptor 43a-like [Sitodiplosis mosellana]
MAERRAKIIWNSLTTIAIFAASMKFVTSFVKYYVSNLSEESFELIFSSEIPWNWKEPIGYLVAGCVQFTWFYGGIYIVICTMLCFVGFCTLFEAFTLDIGRNLLDLNDNIVEAHGHFKSERRIELYQQFSKIIQFHSIARDFVDRFSTAYSLILLIFFGLATTCICASLLSLNSAFDAQHFVDILRLVIYLFFMTTYIAFLCYFGDEVHTRFETINYSIYQCCWYEFPLEMQKLQITMLNVAQKPVYVRGYMNTRCTRDVLQTIINAAFSYFSILRGVSQ